MHNYNFDVAGDGQLYSTVEDLLRWDDYLHGAEKPEFHPTMLTEGTLENGDKTGYAQGLRLDEYRGLRTVGHSGSSWGFRTELVRFLEPGLSIAIACNADFAEPGELAERVADHYLAESLGPESSDEEPDEDPKSADATAAGPSLTTDQLAPARRYLLFGRAGRHLPFRAHRWRSGGADRAGAAARSHGRRR